MTYISFRTQSVFRISIVSLIFFYIGFAPVASADTSKFTVKELLSQCVENNSDVIIKEVSGRECKQYIRGYTDALARYAKKEVCVPNSPSRVKLIRKVFVNWATKNKDKHHWDAPKGLTAAIKSSVNCVN